ncbi:MAG: transglycosylase SLT domain-containing protein [Cytophagaceae bacterium]|nr:transglycosylase SLT domain-containing protein [Cytophagaceae bacterium]
MERKKLLRIFVIVLLMVNIFFTTTSFAQIEETEEPINEGVEEIEEVEVEDSVFVVTPSDIPVTTPVLSTEVPIVPDELIADRLSCLEKEMPLTFNKTIRTFVDYFTVRNRKYAVVMERRKNLYFPIFEEYLKKHNMPDELKYLSIVESGLNPRAVSPAGAAGLWQFMPGTGKIYHLEQNPYIDERMDPYQATEAACKYLKELYNIFNDWELALASYNCGPGNVRKAIRRSGYKDSFWEVYKYLPAETRGYVPQFVAVIYTMNYLKDHNMVADTIEYPMQFDTIQVSRNLNLNKLCEQLNICMEDIEKLNPALKKNIIPGHLNYVLRIPSDKYPFFAENRNVILDSCSKDCEKEINLITVQVAQANTQRKIVYTVRNGDVLGKIAARHNVTVSQLRSWNKLRGNTIRVGQRLVIYKKGAVNYNANSNNTTVAKTEPKTTKTLSKGVYYVQPGDTLWSISRKSNLTIDQLKKKNNLKGNDLKVGMKLIIG